MGSSSLLCWDLTFKSRGGKNGNLQLSLNGNIVGIYWKESAECFSEHMALRWNLVFAVWRKYLSIPRLTAAAYLAWGRVRLNVFVCEIRPAVANRPDPQRYCYYSASVSGIPVTTRLMWEVRYGACLPRHKHVHTQQSCCWGRAECFIHEQLLGERELLPAS